jgi:DNA-binding beta-propeller fold protein YncE
VRKIGFSDTGQAALGRLDPNTGDIVLWPIPGGQEPFALAFTPAGEIWFTDREADLLGLFRRETGEFLLWPVPLGSHPLFLAVGQDRAVWFTAERGNYVGRLAGSPLGASPGPLAPESFVVTGYAVSQSGNKAELTIAYTYAGTAGVPIWPTVAVLREGQVLPGFSAPLAAIETAGLGKVNLLLTYQGIGL